LNEITIDCQASVLEVVMSKDVVAEIDEIFNPRSIAVVGVSDKVNRLGNLMLYSFMDIGFEGDLYPINPKEDSVMGLKCYPQIRAIEGPVDIVIVSVHPNRVTEVIDDCIAKGVKAAVIFSSGFREKGDLGWEREKEIVAKARGGGVRIIGPNCMGLWRCFSLSERFNGKFIGILCWGQGDTFQQDDKRWECK
jgi:acyl-CoA synthetase (NDP forming)